MSMYCPRCGEDSWITYDCELCGAEYCEDCATKDEVIEGTCSTCAGRGMSHREPTASKGCIGSATDHNISVDEARGNANLWSGAAVLLEAAKHAVEQCPCTLKERESGHRVGCYAIELNEAIEKAIGE